MMVVVNVVSECHNIDVVLTLVGAHVLHVHIYSGVYKSSEKVPQE